MSASQGGILLLVILLGAALIALAVVWTLRNDDRRAAKKAATEQAALHNSLINTSKGALEVLDKNYQEEHRRRKHAEEECKRYMVGRAANRELEALRVRALEVVRERVGDLRSRIADPRLSRKRLTAVVDIIDREVRHVLPTLTVHDAPAAGEDAAAENGEAAVVAAA